MPKPSSDEHFLPIPNLGGNLRDRTTDLVTLLHRRIGESGPTEYRRLSRSSLKRKAAALAGLCFKRITIGTTKYQKTK